MTISTLPQLKMCQSVACAKIATGIGSKYCYIHDKIRAIKPYSAAPKPSSRSISNYIGVELECFNPSDVHRVTHVARYVCRDGSLPVNGGEIKLCAKENKIENDAADVAQRAALVGNKVNKKCGFHIHVSLPGWRKLASQDKLAGMLNLTNLFMKLQEEIFELMPPSRRDNMYCKRINNYENLNNHYSWASLSTKYETLEIRIHGSTLNPWKVKGWINAIVQLRPAMLAAITNDISWYTLYENRRSIFDFLEYGTVGQKYLQSRKDGNGVLEYFGFPR